MKGFDERNVSLKCFSKTASISGTGSDPGPSNSKFPKSSSVWSSLFASAFSIFDPYSENKVSVAKTNGWTSAVKRAVSGGSMRRIHERILGPSKVGMSSLTSDIWLLGICYKISQQSSEEVDATNGLDAFKHDFSSRILMTYRKGLLSSTLLFS